MSHDQLRLANTDKFYRHKVMNDCNWNQPIHWDYMSCIIADIG